MTTKDDNTSGAADLSASDGYIFRPMSWELYPAKETRFSDYVTEISIEDEAPGEFVTVKQPMRSDGKIAIDPDEWEPLKNAIDSAFAEIHSHNTNDSHD